MGIIHAYPLLPQLLQIQFPCSMRYLSYCPVSEINNVSHCPCEEMGTGHSLIIPLHALLRY